MINLILIRLRRLKRLTGYHITHYVLSIRRFLTLTLLGMLTAAMVMIAIANYWQLTAQNQDLITTQLSNAAQVLIALENASSENASFSLDEEAHYLAISANLSPDSTPLFGKELAFSVFDATTNKVLTQSNNMPKLHGIDYKKIGLQVINDNQDTWYVYILIDPKIKAGSMLVLNQAYIQELNRTLFYRNLNILFVVYLIMAAILLLVIEVALQPLQRVTEAVSLRDPDNLLAIRLRHVPLEIRPMLKELNKLFKKVRDTIEREKRFTADAAHELRTPLAALKTQVEVARREPDSEERAVILRNIIKGVNRCAHVIEQLLTLSRLEPQARLKQLQRVDLCQIAAEMVAELAPLAIEKDLDIDLSTPEHDIIIDGNSISLGILLRNLIDNAIRYTPPHGRVHIIVEEHMDHISLQVLDNGPGIPSYLHHRIFERFFRQLGNKAEGSGLGLSIVRQIVRLHHATITAKQPATGTGLIMYVSFPLVVNSMHRYTNTL